MVSSVAGSRRPWSIVVLLTLAVAALVAVLFLATSPARAVLNDGGWTGGGTGEAEGLTTVVANGDAGVAQFRYDLPDGAIFDNNASGEWTFQTIAQSTGTQDIYWQYGGFHAFFQVEVELEAFVISNEGHPTEVWSQTLVDAGPVDCCSPPSQSFFYDGFASFDVQAGDTYGFRMRGSNLDYNATLRGTLTLDGFAAEVFPLVGSVAAGEMISIEAQFYSGFDDPDGDSQDVDSILAQLGPGLSYVADSSILVDPFDPEGPGSPIDDPAIDLTLNELTWAPEYGFVIDSIYGLGIRFDVMVDPSFLDEYDPIGIVKVFGQVGGYESGGTATFTVTEPPELPPALVALQQAVPLADGEVSFTGLVGLLTPEEPTNGEPYAFEGELEVYYDSFCSEGSLGEEPALLGSFVFPDEAIGENGGLFFALAIENNFSAEDGFVAAQFNGGDLSPCIAVGPDNTSWTRAQPVTISEGFGSSDGIIDQTGQGRWFKFAIRPGAKATVTLTGLPADYDLAVFKDIQQKYDELTGDVDVDDLHQLSAEFAPSVFSPSVFSPSVFSPSVFSPDAYSPSVFSPSVFSPSVFSPSVFSPSVFSPDAYSPSVFSPSVFSPSVFSPSVFSPSVFSGSEYAPSVFSEDVFSPSVFSPDAFASAQTRSIIGVSAKVGTGDEVVIANTWTNTGDFYIRVTGRNGVFNVEERFDLEIELEGSSCPSSFTQPAERTLVPSTADTVILWDSSRIEGDPGPLGASLDLLAARPEVDGVVIDLFDDSEINALRAQAAANVECVYATNLVAEGIKNIVDSHRNSELKYVVLVGGDDSIPFFRYPDQALLGPEEDYEPPVRDDSASQASLRLNYILGQDEYGSQVSVSAGDGSIPIPDLAVGRVVETAAEAKGVIDAYLGDDDGVVLSGTGIDTLTTGYDFLTDAATAVADSFDQGTGGTGDRLIDPADRSPADPLTWTADDLRSALFGPDRIDLVYLAGHFSANSALAADYQTSVITTELAASTTDFTNSIIFSGGCHSGYNIVNGEIVPGVTLDLDWAQAFAQKGATLIAGTGYQYGDTDFVEYSERLYAGFADELRAGTGPVAVGSALVEAKQDYLETTPDMTGLHRKSFIISTVFGLPMISVDLPQGRGAVDDSTSIVGALSGFPVQSPGGFLGLEFTDVGISETLAEENVNLTPLDGSSLLEATYYTGPNGVVTNPAQPALPLISKNVSVDGKVLRGVGFRGGDYADLTGSASNPLLPLTGAPVTELRGVHTPFASERFFPLRLATVNYFGELSENGRGTVLNVTPAQHRVQTIGDLNTILRIFSDIDLRLYYSGNTTIPALAAPPTITQVSAEEDESNLEFEVFVVGDPAAGIQEVWVTYTHGGIAEWLPLDLTQDLDDSTRWFGTLVGGASLSQLEFIAQAANGVGLVAIDDSYGGNFEVGTPEDPTNPTELTLSTDGLGTFGAVESVSATLTSSGTPVADAAVLFTIGGASRVGVTDVTGVATAELPLTSVPGAYDLSATFGGDEQFEAAAASADFLINKAPTSMAVVSPSDPVAPGEPTGLTATLTGPGGGPLNERTVFFTVAGDAATQTIPVITTFSGVANLGGLDLPAGDYTVTAQFLGNTPYPAGNDETYLASSATGSVTIEDAPDNDGDGIPDDIDDDDDNDGIVDTVEVTIGTDPLVAEVGRQFKRAVRSFLAPLDGTWFENGRLWWVDRWLGQALADHLWVDDDSLKLIGGWYVFNRERKVVDSLTRIVNRGGDLSDEAQVAIEVLVFVDRQLAQTQLDDSTAAGGLPGQLAESQQHLDRADGFAAAGKWSRAVRQYGLAWDDARDAILLK